MFINSQLTYQSKYIVEKMHMFEIKLEIRIFLQKLFLQCLKLLWSCENWSKMIIFWTKTFNINKNLLWWWFRYKKNITLNNWRKCDVSWSCWTCVALEPISLLTDELWWKILMVHVHFFLDEFLLKRGFQLWPV